MTKTIGIVTPWFGKELKGGAEQFAWQIAHRLAEHKYNIEVLTTCCRSFYDNWNSNYYDEGVTPEDNLTIRRFSVDKRLDALFKLAVEYLLSFSINELKNNRLLDIKIGIEELFIKENINSTQMYEYLKDNNEKYHAFIFIPYLYGTTLNGLPLVAEKSFLQPCLHEEPYAYLTKVEEVFLKCKGILFNSEGEFILANRIYGPGIWNKSSIVGGGCEVVGDRIEIPSDDIKIISKEKRYVLYIGKRDETKNIDLMIEAFINYKKFHDKSELKLILAGPGNTNFEDIEYGVIDIGEIEEHDKIHLLKNCLAVFQPSQNESYSRVIMEAWLNRKPVAAHKDCLATSIPVNQSKGGWTASSSKEWTDLFCIVDSCENIILNEISENGYKYAVKHGLWDNAIKKYNDVLNLTDRYKALKNTSRKKKIREIHQLTPGFAYGDAITNQTLIIRDYLRAIGYDSEIYSLYIDSKLSMETEKFDPSLFDNGSAIFYHHSIGSKLTEFAIKHPGPKALLYHNITPYELIKDYNKKLAIELKEGRDDLKRLSKHFNLSCGISEFNALELTKNGFTRPDTFPIIIDPSKWTTAPNYDLMKKLKDGCINIIFVGRIIPSKCQHDLIYAFSEYLNMDPHARLILIGSFVADDLYCKYVEKLPKKLGINDKVVITNLVNDRDLHTFYRTAHLYWSMSAHEGFGVPLIESFWFDIPVLAFKSSAIPETLGNAGLMFNSKKKLAQIAALAKLIVRDSDLREKILISQRKRREDFLPQKIYPKIDRLIDAMIQS